MKTQINADPSAVQAAILTNLDHAALLEKLYRNDKTLFKIGFNQLYPEIKDSKAAQFWNERLNYETDVTSTVSKKDLIFLILAIISSGLLAKIPDFTSISEDYFYPRNLSFVVFPALIFYFAWKNQLSAKGFYIIAGILAIAAVYINALPNRAPSDTLILACIHLPLFLWAVLAYAFTGTAVHEDRKRLDFLRFNGELLVLSAIMLICGGMLTAVSFGLFELIDISIELFFTKYILVFGLPAVPVLGTYLVHTQPQLVRLIAPVVAKVFTPLVLVLQIVYLLAVAYTGKDPYNDREFLILFNVLLIGVMALIFFSISANAKSPTSKVGQYLLLALAGTTIIVNVIALSAIIFRISEWGMTPNRLAVVVANLLMLGHLSLIAFQLFQSVKAIAWNGRVENAISKFLPIYIIWALIVILILPFVFHFQ